MPRNRHARDRIADPIGELGITRREADEPDRDDLGSLAAGDADWVAAAERVTGRRVRPGTEADTDVTREFWGDAPGWRSSREVRRTGDRPTGRTAGGRVAPRRTPGSAPIPSAADVTADAVGDDTRDDTGAEGLLSRWTSGWRRPAPPTVRNGRVERTRSHRVVDAADARPEPARPTPRERPAPPDRSEAAAAVEVEFDHDVPAPPTPPGSRPTLTERTGLDAVDPLVRRLGALLLIGVLLVPVALALRSPSTERELGIRSLASGELADWLPMPAVNRGAPPTDAGATDAAGTTRADTTSSDDPAAAGAADACALEYTVAAGDYWLRLAEESGVPLAELLSANGATIETAIHPGDEVCLPDGASVPAPPPPPTTAAVSVTASGGTSSDTTSDTTSGTTATGSSDVAASQSATTPTSPPTTAAPATTAPPTTAAPATTVPPTTAPPTTAPPTTAAPSRPPSSANPSPEQIRAMIREVFPEDEHEMAINVARRESTFRANAYNGWCCHGIFQIHWQAHRGWLNGRGITSVEQLYDARTNVELAYEIFQRSGGWGPWSATAY